MQTMFNTQTVFKFGKYAGFKAGKVAEFDPTYIFYLASKDSMYVADNLLLRANAAK